MAKISMTLETEIDYAKPPPRSLGVGLYYCPYIPTKIGNLNYNKQKQKQKKDKKWDYGL